MKINLFFIPCEIEDVATKDMAGVVIDVLRSSSSIITALENKCSKIIPTNSIENAKKLASSIGADKSVLLCGESKGKTVEGFQLGNSPIEYENEIVENKILIFTTTNGTQTILRSKAANPLYIGAFLNVKALAKHLSQTTDYFFIACSGNNNQFSLDDTVCAGMLVDEIKKLVSELELSDSALAAFNLYQTYKNELLQMMQQSKHGQYLIENDLIDDIKFCSQVNKSQVIPIYSEGCITAITASVPE